MQAQRSDCNLKHLWQNLRSRLFPSKGANLGYGKNSGGGGGGGGQKLNNNVRLRNVRGGGGGNDARGQSPHP